MSVTLIEAPAALHPLPSFPKLFMAGGITGCHLWQDRLIELLARLDDFIIFNPRRKIFEPDPGQSVEELAYQQIVWEHVHLKMSNAISFWFPPETLCPITLFEYGRWLVSDKKIFVGAHPDYQRRFDLIVQTRLEYRNLTVANTLEELADSIIQYYSSPQKP